MSELTLIQRTGQAADFLRRLLPGLLVSALVAATATFLSGRFGGPVMLFAFVLGMAFHFLSQDGRCAPGLEIASKKILREGVALLGARITAEQILALGIAPMLMVVAGVLVS